MKKKTTKNLGSDLNITQPKNDSKDIIRHETGPASHNANRQRDSISSKQIKGGNQNPASLRPPALQPTGFLRKLSFRDRRGSNPSPFLNSNVDTIIPIPSKLYKAPTQHPSPTISPQLRSNKY